MGRRLRLREERLALQLMALGFGVGSLLFATGAVLSVLGGSASNAVFVVGAWCFTAAATVQWRTSVHHSHESLRRRAELDLRNPDWQAAVIQLIGTLEFNVMTTRALTVSLTDPSAYNAEVWRPDGFGSIAFLLSSAIALHPIARHRRHLMIPRRSNMIAWSNMAGSALFAVSAIGSYAIADQLVRSPLLNNAGTFFGALGFLLAAVLTWPPRAKTNPQAAPTPAESPST